MSNAISINNSVLMGRLTRDPELRYTKNNRPVATFKLRYRAAAVQRSETLSPVSRWAAPQSLQPVGFKKGHWPS